MDAKSKFYELPWVLKRWKQSRIPRIFGADGQLHNAADNNGATTAVRSDVTTGESKQIVNRSGKNGQ